MLFSVVHTNFLVDSYGNEVIILMKDTTSYAEIIKYYLKDYQGEHPRLIFSYQEPNENKLDDMLDLATTFINAGWDIAFRFPLTEKSLNICRTFQDKQISYFFNYYCRTKTSLMRIFDLGVSDIYVHGELCFSLKDIQALKLREPVKFRTVPNQPTMTEIETYIDPIKTFWIRPQDLDVYEKYIDVLEFPPATSIALLRVYKERKWEGRMIDIIPETELEVCASSIPPTFGEVRVNCGLECAYNNCQICAGCINFAKTLDEKHLEIRKEQ